MSFVFQAGHSYRSHGKYRQLASTARGFMQPLLIGIEAGRTICVHSAHMVRIISGRGFAVSLSCVRVKVAIVQPREHLFWRFTQLNTQMIDQLKLPIRIDLSEQRQFGVGRAALNQRPA